MESTPSPPPSLPPWLRVALLSLALLFVPIAAWLLIPEPEPPKRARTLGREDLPADLDVEEEDDEADPPPRPPREPEEAPPPEEEPDEILGTVVSGASVVPSVLVTCTKPNGEELIAPSGFDGRFKFPLEWEGCTAVARTNTHGASPPVVLRRKGDNQLELPGQGGISGTVVDERGLAVTSFLVVLDHAILADGSRMPGAAQRKFDDVEGRFSLERLGAGRWTLEVSAPGRPPTAVDVVVESGKTTEDVRVRLERGATLLGTVIDRTSRRAIGGARVRVEGDDASAFEPVTTSPGGDFRLEGVPAGAFSVEVEHDDYVSRIVSGLDAKGQRQLRTTIDLAPIVDGGGRLEMSGIGASLNTDQDGRVRVTLVREGGPAEKAGLQADDRIASIDGVSAEGLSVGDAVQRLRGPAGTEVVVGVDRGGSPLTITITRDVIVH